MKRLILAITVLALSNAACDQTATQNNSTNAVRVNQTASANENSKVAAANHGGMDHSAMNHNASDQTMKHAGADHANMKSSPGAADAPYDLQFLDTMIAHHEGAVEMARPAESKAAHAELKTMARNIIRDQTGEIALMKQYRDRWFSGKPVAINMEMAGMRDSMKDMDMTRLNAASGNEFDQLFLAQMTPHHEGAIVMSKEALQKAEHPEIKRLAQNIISAQEKEIRQMNEWKNRWKQ